jgi:BMFP domain-containing protein YqiC
MKIPDFLNDLNKKLCDALPPGLQTLKQDLEKNFHAVLINTFNKLDLVTREEFDAQTKVLARTRKKIEALEIEIKRLENEIENKG